MSRKGGFHPLLSVRPVLSHSSDPLGPQASLPPRGGSHAPWASGFMAPNARAAKGARRRPVRKAMVVTLDDRGLSEDIWSRIDVVLNLPCLLE